MEWISVKERLPNSEEYVLVCLKYGRVRVGRYIYNTWNYCSGVFMTELAAGEYAVTHWMPLPEPPND